VNKEVEAGLDDWRRQSRRLTHGGFKCPAPELGRAQHLNEVWGLAFGIDKWFIWIAVKKRLVGIGKNL
jgi:hypothetical protein